ncbi:hypothetical protein C0995_016296, partial [Termitomyces sp. Mi166
MTDEIGERGINLKVCKYGPCTHASAQRFQRMQYNKKLATKKVNKAKAEAALQHRAINDFSRRIPDGLGVKVWGPLDVERLNS